MGSLGCSAPWVQNRQKSEMFSILCSEWLKKRDCIKITKIRYPWYSEMLSYPGTLVLWRVHFESNASCRVCEWTGELLFLLIRDSLWFSFQPEKTSEAAVVDPESQVWHFLPQSSSSNSAVFSRQTYIINSLLLLAMQFVNRNWWNKTKMG